MCLDCVPPILSIIRMAYSAHAISDSPQLRSSSYADLCDRERHFWHLLWQIVTRFPAEIAAF